MIRKFIFGKPFETDATVLQIAKENHFVDNLASEKLKSQDCHVLCSDNGFSFECNMTEETVVYGLGQAMGNINKRGRTYTSYCSDDPSHTENKESLYGAHNFVLLHNPSDINSARGFFFDYPTRITFDIGYTKIDQIKISCKTCDIAIFEILPEQNSSIKNDNPLKNIVRQFRQLIGQSYIPPRWALGFMQSRWGYKTEQDIRAVYENYKKAGIPLDSICLDIDYMKDYKDFTVDPERFSDLKKFSDELKSDGVRLVPIIDAGVKIEDGYDVYEEGVKKNYFCKKQDGKNFVAGVWPGRTHFPDFMKADAREWFGQKYKILTDMGIEGFWNDMNEPAIFYSDEGLEEVIAKIKAVDTSNLDINSFFSFKDIVLAVSNSQDDYNRFYHEVTQDGKTFMVKHNDIHNLYGYNMTRSAGEELAKIRDGKRTLLFSRSSYIGMHRYGGIWTGDNCSWWEHLALEIRMMPSLNMCGFLYTGADIGGFGCNATRELLLRWLAFGVFTPLMRNHSAIGTRDQECYQFENSEDFKSIVNVRYRLLPYLYSEYVKSCVNNESFFKPLSFDYPNDSRCLEINDQLMLANEIMVAPVYTQNAKGRMVYLPEDMILVRFMPDGNIQQSEISAGDHYIQVALNEVVMFVKKGCVIPVGKPAQNSDKLDYENLELIGDVSSKAFYSLYKDDGYTTQIDLDKNTKQIK